MGEIIEHSVFPFLFENKDFWFNNNKYFEIHVVHLIVKTKSTQSVQF